MLVILLNSVALTSNHDSTNVGFMKVLQDSRGLSLQLVLHDYKAKKLHVCLYVVPN